MLLLALRLDKSEFVAVFGRRRVGKTYLVQESFRNTFAFVHTGLSNEGMKKQLAEFRYSLETAAHGRSFRFSDWSGAFHALQEFLDGLPRGKKVVFIDEMPWMDTARSGFVSALEHFWNGWANFRRDIVLVVCGSATSWIINKEYAWRHIAEGEDDKGAQIDLVIDRSDGVVNLCEMKYSRGRYAISHDYAVRLVERAQTFADKVASGKSVFTTMVTPCGVQQDENSSVVQSEITAEDLFAD